MKQYLKKSVPSLDGVPPNKWGVRVLPVLFLCGLRCGQDTWIDVNWRFGTFSQRKGFFTHTDCGTNEHGVEYAPIGWQPLPTICETMTQKMLEEEFTFEE